MKKLIILCFVVLCLGFISGLCEEGQIDINSASLEKLEEIDHVGPKVAGYIVDARPFISIEELVNVSYISSGYLEDIIIQGLACVNGYEEEPEEVAEEEPKEEIIEEAIEAEIIIETAKDDDDEEPEIQIISSETIKAEVINLGTKDIKSEDDKEVLDKENIGKIAKYGFIVFCILIGVLLILKNKKKQKNELV